MSTIRRAALVAALLGAAAPLAPAHAACFGSATTARLCVYPENVHVDPTGGPGFDDCVSVGVGSCIPVHVPTPSAGTTQPVYELECFACDDAGPLVQYVVGLVPDYGPVVDNVDENLNRIVENMSRMECAPAQSRQSAESLKFADTLRDNLEHLRDSCL